MSLTIINAGQNYHIRGGAERYQFALAQLLHHHGHQVIPFAAEHAKNEITPWSKYFPKRVDFEQPTPKDLLEFVYSRSAALSMESLLYDRQIDLAHLHIYYGQLTASILSPLKKADVPIVQTLHEYKIVCPVYTLLSDGNVCQACNGHAFWQATLKRCNKGSLSRSILSTVESYVSKMLGSVNKIDHFIAVSYFQREKLIELGLRADKVTTVHNFIDASDYQPSTALGEYFLYFGRLEQSKGIFTLIEAASSIKDTPLLIVGDGTVRPKLEKLIQERELNHIILLGFKHMQELQKLIRHSICTITPSQWYETFGLTLIESFAHGRPVIASEIGGMTEIVTDGIDGHLVHPGNAEQLRERMLWMAEHLTQAREMGLAGRRKVETHFNPESHYQKLISVYQKVL
ncbi:glycosyltransferase family 4 protein [Pleurocapsa sp. FMAR1]|uniref:glycosyltransferase family 4 protein n=1 Tax=Pleurocapsa sp. FMAR1 TaxID=3040204 RepID=UPI0029C886DC|nr:glycosyltransferase family 4 protein [Pleurocapsa sp. FMAR1]